MTATTTVHSFLNHIFSGDMEEALELVNDEARFISTNPSSNPNNPMHGTFIGMEGAKQFFGQFAELLEPGDFDIQASFGDHEHAALYGTLRHTVRKTGKDFASNWALICRINDEKIMTYHFYEDSEALSISMK